MNESRICNNHKPYELYNRAENFIKQTLMFIHIHTGPDTVIVDHFDIPLSTLDGHSD